MIQVGINSKEQDKHDLVCSHTMRSVLSNHQVVGVLFLASYLGGAKTGIDLFCPPVV